MNVHIASPIGGADYEDISYVSVWSVDGQMGILPGHADLIAALRPGQVRIDLDSGQVLGVAGSGFIRIEGGTVYISAEQWTADPGDLDIDSRLEEIDGTLSLPETGAATHAKLGREKQFLEACRG